MRWLFYYVDYGSTDLRRPWPFLPEPIELEENTSETNMQALATSLENLKVRQNIGMVDWRLEIFSPSKPEG